MDEELAECHHLSVALHCSECEQSWPIQPAPIHVLMTLVGMQTHRPGDPWRAEREEVQAAVRGQRCIHLGLQVECLTCPEEWPHLLPVDVLVYLVSTRLSPPDQEAWERTREAIESVRWRR